jgi:hypothetical protein
MTDDDLKSATAAIDRQIGEAKTELLALTKVEIETTLKILDARKKLSNLCRQRDELLTPDLFA